MIGDRVIHVRRPDIVPPQELVERSTIEKLMSVLSNGKVEPPHRPTALELTTVSVVESCGLGIDFGMAWANVAFQRQRGT